MNKKVIAREWLIFLGLMVLGFILVIGITIVSPHDSVSRAFKELVRGNLIIWGVILSPYILYQFGRFVVWAVKALKSKEDE